MAIRPKPAMHPDGYTFMTPDEIDAVIREKVNSLPKHPGAKGQTPRKKWGEAELMLRRQVVTDLLCQGLSMTRIKQELMARWGVSESTAGNYVHDAINHMATDNEEVREKQRDIMIHRLEGVAEDALAKGDRKSAISAYDQLNKINGLYKEHIEADVKTEITFDFQ